MTKQHEWTVATEPLCCNCPMARSCRALWASLAQPYRGQPLSRHHAHCSDRRQQFPVETENSLSQSRLLPPWPTCVMTSTTIATQGQPSPVATEKNSVATQAIQFAHGLCCDTDGHVATRALLCRTCTLVLPLVHPCCAHPGRVMCAAWGPCLDQDFLSRQRTRILCCDRGFSVMTEDQTSYPLHFQIFLHTFIKYYCFCTTCTDNIKSGKISHDTKQVRN